MERMLRRSLAIILLLGVVSTVLLANAVAQSTDSMPVSVWITNPEDGTSTPGVPTPRDVPTPPPGATPTATPGGGSNGGGSNGGGNPVTSLPSTGVAADDGSDLVPAFLILTGGGLLAGSVLVRHRRTT